MLEWLSKVRREFHRHPETAHEEFQTTTRIKELLNEMGVSIIDYPDLESGVVGLIQSGKQGPTLGLRADIDALNITEENDVPYKSMVDGKMHACGHDGHTTILLGVAKRLMAPGATDSLMGNIKLIFQPAEEALSGAEKMVQAGVLNAPDVDMVLTAHMLPDLPVGQIGICRDYSHAASDRIHVTLKGKGAHAARPNQAVDPVVCGAYFLTAAQTIISRNINPINPAVITFGRLTAGSSFNIIPVSAELEGTVRTLQPDIRELVISRLREQLEGLKTMFGIDSEFHIMDSIIACYNDPEASNLLECAAKSVLTPESVMRANPVMGSEDFALFSEKTPGAIFRIGCSNKSKGITGSLHSATFDMDESAMLHGVDIFMETIRQYLG